MLRFLTFIHVALIWHVFCLIANLLFPKKKYNLRSPQNGIPNELIICHHESIKPFNPYCVGAMFIQYRQLMNLAPTPA